MASHTRLLPSFSSSEAKESGLEIDPKAGAEAATSEVFEINNDSERLLLDANDRAVGVSRGGRTGIAVTMVSLEDTNGMTRAREKSIVRILVFGSRQIDLRPRDDVGDPFKCHVKQQRRRLYAKKRSSAKHGLGLFGCARVCEIRAHPPGLLEDIEITDGPYEVAIEYFHPIITLDETTHCWKAIPLSVLIK